MKVGAISDSHGNIDWLTRVVDWLKKMKCQKMVHLGDEWEDMNEWADMVIRVPGILSSYYKNEKIPNRLIMEFNHWPVLLTHTLKSYKDDLPNDLKPEEVIKSGEARVVLYGHTHIPKVEKKGSILYINPGHLKPEDKQGFPASFAFLDFEPTFLNVKIIDFKTMLPKNSYFFWK